MNKGSSNFALIKEKRDLPLYIETLNKLKAIYKFSYEKSTWYSKKLPQIKKYKNFTDLWREVPVLTKEILRNHGEELITNPRNKNMFEVRTTGSTGTPTISIWDKSEYNKCTMEVWKTRKEYGAKFSDTIIYFIGLPKEGREELVPEIKKISKNVYEFTRVFNEEACRTYIDFINDLHGVILYGSPSTIYNFSSSIKKLKISPPNISCIELNGEMCEGYEYDTIKDILSAPIINNYGAREMWPIALSCEYDTMHVCNNLVYVENNSDGEIFVSSLVKKTQPLIRYKIGDLGRVEWARCKCGKVSQVLTSLVGRKNDFIYRSVGIKEHWALLSKVVSNFIINNIGTIKEYSIHQKKDYR